MTTLGKSQDYVKLLRMINDNADGRQGPFSIQNVVRMSLVFDKYPGEWHGNKSISLVFSHLNKIYQPVQNFEICLFGDETIVWDKIEKKANRQQRNWLENQLSRLESLNDERQDRALIINSLFSTNLNQKTTSDFIIEVDSNFQFGQQYKWRNTVLVIVCCRMGMKQV